MPSPGLARRDHVTSRPVVRTSHLGLLPCREKNGELTVCAPVGQLGPRQQGSTMQGLSRRGRWSAITLSVGIVLSTASVAVGETAIATPAANPSAATASDGPSNNPAMLRAQELGKPVEDMSRRTETLQVFANPNGTYTSEQFADPVRTQDGSGNWHDIDTDLVRVNGGYAPKHAIGGLRISDGGDRTFAAVDPEGKAIQFRWPSSLPEPSVEGNTATYPDVVENGDLVVTALPTGFRHDIVLKAPPADPLALSFPIVTPGSKASEEQDGALEISTTGGEDLLTAPRPVMYDSSVDDMGLPTAVPVATEVSQTPNGSTQAWPLLTDSELAVSTRPPPIRGDGTDLRTTPTTLRGHGSR